MPLLTRRTHRAPIWLPLVIFALLLAADQSLKAWALTHLTPGQPPVVAVPGVVEWVLTFNTGAAWSLFSGSATPLALGRLVIGLAILVYLVWRPQPRFMTVVLSMIAAGAVGNAVDGLRLGRVTDMIHAPPLSAVTTALGQGGFPIFNIADSCVVVGTVLLVIGTFIAERPRRAL